MRTAAHSPETRYWLDRIARYAIGPEKMAELGGSGNDIPFEQAFANLAHAYLREKAPTLLDHELGFQLLERNNENTKAVGVFGFKVGSMLLYGPVFFLNGNLKGHELLYLKNSDQFVPLKENWLDDILNKKPNILGKAVTRNSAQLGMQTPSFSRLVNSPSKYGSANPTLRELMDPVLPVFADCATLNVREAFADIGASLNLPNFLKEAGMQMLESLVRTCRDYPELAEAIDQFHGLSCIETAIKSAGERLKQASGAAACKPRPPQHVGWLSLHEHPIKTGALRILRYDADTTTPPAGLTPDEVERLRADRLLIKDARDDSDVSVPYTVQVEQRLQNPHETGLYDVLVRPDKFEKCLVLINAQGADGPARFATVIRVGDDANWLNTPATEIWTTKQYSREEFADWWAGLKKPTGLTKDGARYVLIGETGTATLPFRVEREYSDGGDEQVFDVDLDDNCYRRSLTATQKAPEYDSLNYDRWRDGQRIHLNGKQGTKLRSVRGDIYVPEDFKMLTVSKTRADKTDGEMPCSPCYSGSSDSPPILPGDLADAYMNLTRPKFSAKSETKEAAEITLATPRQVKLALAQQLTALELSSDGPYVQVNGRSMHHREALVHLVRDHGFREKVAADLLVRAPSRRTATFHVKYAAPYGGGSPFLTDSQPSAPTMPEPPVMGGSWMHDSANTRVPYQDSIPVTDVASRYTDPQVYNPNPNLDRGMMLPELSQVMQAAQTGQKEVFDTAMIGTMLKAVRDDTMIDRYIGDLMKGLDRLGRILFMFYWHGDKFAERYGKQDLPELEDSLRNAFEMVGDVILFLKQKMIQPYPEESQEIDLEPVANT